MYSLLSLLNCRSSLFTSLLPCFFWCSRKSSSCFEALAGMFEFILLVYYLFTPIMFEDSLTNGLSWISSSSFCYASSTLTSFLNYNYCFDIISRSSTDILSASGLVFKVACLANYLFLIDTNGEYLCFSATVPFRFAWSTWLCLWDWEMKHCLFLCIIAYFFAILEISVGVK